MKEKKLMEKIAELLFEEKLISLEEKAKVTQLIQESEAS